jgi:hypothetical protein
MRPDLAILLRGLALLPVSAALGVAQQPLKRLAVEFQREN